MASGTLGQSALTGSTNTAVYVVPTGKVATFNINIVNRTASGTTVRLAIAATSTPTDAEYLEYDTVLPANGVLERTGLVATAGKNIVVYAGITGVSANVYGFEE